MQNLMLVVVMISVLLIIYNYVLYPLLVILLSKYLYDSHAGFYTKVNNDFFPTVTLIIAAYNEEKVIEKKIKNTLDLDYPNEKLQIIVVSDGSDDATSEIANSFKNKGVISLHETQRNGKSAALNRAAEYASGDVLLFSDANNDYDKNAIKNLVRHFSDDAVGAVTGSKHIYKNNMRQSSKGDGLYWRYESQIKMAESRLGSITAAEGEILAVRKSLFSPINQNLINDDAAITFSIVKNGYRVLYDADASAYEEASKDMLDDFHVKVRMASGGYQTLSEERSYLFPPKTWFAFSFLSHKFLRWVTPHLMMVILILSIIMSCSGDALITAFLVLQILFYSISLYGWLNRSDENLPSLVYIIMYFTSMNMAMFIGHVQYLNKNSNVSWRKAER